MNKTFNVKTALPFAIISLFLVLGPILAAQLATPHGYIFLGTLANHNDFSAYLAAMRQGAEGNWLFHFNFSPEAWRPQLMLPIYITAGKILPGILYNSTWVNIIRVIALIGTLAVYGMWVRLVYPNEFNKQWSAWILLVFGGGLGWLLLPIASLIGIPNSANLFPDIVTPEWTLGLVGSNAPHYMIGLLLETMFFISYWNVTQNKGWKWIWASLVFALLLGLTYVYNSAVLFSVVGIYLLWDTWKYRKVNWRKWMESSLILLPLIPLLIYYGYWVNLDPAWAQYVVGEHNRIPPPTWYSLLSGMGIVGILAIAGLKKWHKTTQKHLLISWIAGNLLVMYIPFVQYTGRFTLGLWIPLATLAAYGLEEVVLPWLQQKSWYAGFSKLTTTPYESLRRIILILTIPSSLIVSILFLKNVFLVWDFPFYMPKSEISAMEWLATRTDPQADLVLAYYPVGNYFPSISNTRVFMGQFFLTVNYEEKIKQVEQFWQVETPDSWRMDLINKWKITYIYQGRYEKALYQGIIIPPGELVYDKDDIQIYYVAP